MKILALDLGDAHIGTAISDNDCIVAMPLKTVPAVQLQQFLNEILKTENIATVVVGYPKTLKGTESDQTKKIVLEKERLESEYKNVEWVLWDERLTSKQAAKSHPIKNKADKLQSHSIAAAIILESYLEHLRFRKEFLS